MNDPVLRNLLLRRSSMLQDIRDAWEQLGRLLEELPHLEAVIKMIAPEIEFDNAKSVAFPMGTHGLEAEAPEHPRLQ